MADLGFPTINGYYFDETSIRFTAGKMALSEGLQDISFDEKITPTQIKNLGCVKLGTGLGTHEASASITLLQEYWEKYAAYVAGLSQDGRTLTTVKMNAVINFRAPNAPRLTTVKLFEVRIIGRGFARQGGLQRAIPLDVRFIEENGIRLAPMML